MVTYLKGYARIYNTFQATAVQGEEDYQNLSDESGVLWIQYLRMLLHPLQHLTTGGVVTAVLLAIQVSSDIAENLRQDS